MNDIVRDRDAMSNIIILNVRRAIAYLVLAILTFAALFPFYTMIINSTRKHTEIQSGFSFFPGSWADFYRNFMNAINDPTIPIMTGMVNSLIIAVAAAFLCVYFSAFTAYGIHVYDFKIKKFCFTFILIIMMVPTQVSAPGFLNLITRMGLMDTFWPLILPAIAAPVTFFFMKQYMEASLPLEIVEAARIDGCNEFKTFNRIVMPILKPAIAVQAIFSFVANWNNYFMPALILETANKKTLPVLIAMIRSADFLTFDNGKLYVFIMLSILPVIVVYLILSKFIIRGVTLGAVKG
ncbi:MAG: carbohydrate ABC transporter permease [Oscillospiraceae bacterium]|nr:carbohydrate ABC transporter permease [Oscillospiraceae bacterium]